MGSLIAIYQNVERFLKFTRFVNPMIVAVLLGVLIEGSYILQGVPRFLTRKIRCNWSNASRLRIQIQIFATVPKGPKSCSVGIIGIGKTLQGDFRVFRAKTVKSGNVAAQGVAILFASSLRRPGPTCSALAPHKSEKSVSGENGDPPEFV